MANFERERLGPRDGADTANGIARLFEQGGFAQKSKPPRTKHPESVANTEVNRFGLNDGKDTADAEDFFQRNGYYKRFDTPIGMKSWNVSLPNRKIEGGLVEANTVDEIENFYDSCAEKFFDAHYSTPYNLLPDEIEAEELVLMFEEFKLLLAEELKEERAVLNKSGLRADTLLEDMPLAVLCTRAHFNTQKFIGLMLKETSEIMKENYQFYANFWQKLETIISRSMEIVERKG